MTNEPSRSLDDYDRIEREVGEWAEENFGADQPEWYPLIGAAEEIGEIAEHYVIHDRGQMSSMLELLDAVGDLAHSVLKQAQGIRDDDPDVGAKATHEAVQGIFMAAMEVNNASDLAGSAYLPDEPNLHEEMADGLGDVNVYLADYSYRSPIEYSLAESVELAWYDEVQDREWDSDVAIGDDP